MTFKKSVLATLGLVLGLIVSMTTFTAHANTTSESVKKNAEEFKYDMKTKLSEVDARLESLQNRITKDASKNKKEANIALQKRVNELKEMRTDIASKMDSLGDKTASRYEELKAGIENTYAKLKSELDKSLSE